MSVEGLLDVVVKFIFWFPCFHAGQDCIYFWHSLQRTCWIFNFLLPFWEHCKLPFWHRYAQSSFCHYALAGFEVFHKGSPKLQGSNLVFLWPRWNKFHEIEGQYHFRPSPWYVFPWRQMSHTYFRGDWGLWNFYVSWGPFGFCAYILFSCRSSLHAYDNSCKKHYYLQLCASILGALCAFPHSKLSQCIVTKKWKRISVPKQKRTVPPKWKQQVEDWICSLITLWKVPKLEPPKNSKI